ncbi:MULTISPECIES: WhiB family transcriptional regulator [unclassified Rhodococcus (in: high G+C Gram-positive bacteria)]|uniref:WhiB family transcriptional regulator n=1 Tax=unclassified Rhodococcus (in: high G+C Gram-positive bacteria) TaxID=192944 RepID=UPI0016396536|nr:MULTISPECIES: WhiB family transcriptional regulator [unclassified Rhodococcus (in: high G+C Gram-positive bacteria)]MBC2642008.1 WhiB family transcriptional regulator [Rhodococcus sp. 3A]MBC2893250.1 WhiB family transcriptional regulator [Rhodococcus sp. 4CII]
MNTFASRPTAPTPVSASDWQDRGSCRGTDTDMFFSPEGERGHARARRERAAKQICQDCPVLTECRTHAFTAAEPYGIWGGLSETDRNRHRRRAGRAPRQSRDHGATTRAHAVERSESTSPVTLPTLAESSRSVRSAK